MVRRLQRTAEHERDTELGKVYRAAQLYTERKSQQEIAKEMGGVSISTVSRWLSRADHEEILQTRAVPPPILHLENELAEILGKEMTISVVPDGLGKNIEALGYAGAQQVMEAILRDPAKEKITIALSCGTTVSSVIENLIKLLKDRETQIRQKLEIYPAVLFGSSELHAVYPHTVVAYFAMLARNAKLTAPDGDPLITAYALQLPEGFYRADDRKRHEFIRNWGLNTFVEKIKNADIFLLGAGNLKNDTYRLIAEQLGIEDAVKKLLRRDDNIIQVLYAPLAQDGMPDEKLSDKIIGITVKHVKDVSHDLNKRVILVAGGDEKVKAIQRAIKFPCYNVLVTDVGVAKEAVRRHANGE